MGIDPSQIFQANSAATEANYRALVARNNQAMAQRNAELLEQSAKTAEQQGAVDVDRRHLRTAQNIGSLRASLASQGGDINDGSDVDLVGDTARGGAFDALTASNTAAQKAYQLRLQKMNAENQAGLLGAESADDERKAQDAITGMEIGVAKSLLRNAPVPGNPFPTLLGS